MEVIRLEGYYNCLKECLRSKQYLAMMYQEWKLYLRNKEEAQVLA